MRIHQRCQKLQLDSSKTFHVGNGSCRYCSIRDIHVPYLTSTDIRVCG
nr:MAG TPA: hypothetical protein [Caudoviricetes sp.]